MADIEKMLIPSKILFISLDNSINYLSCPLSAAF